MQKRQSTPRRNLNANIYCSWLKCDVFVARIERAACGLSVFNIIMQMVELNLNLFDIADAVYIKKYYDTMIRSVILLHECDTDKQICILNT